MADEFQDATPRPWFASGGTICTKGGLASIRGEARTVEDGEQARFIADVRGPGPGFPASARAAADAALIVRAANAFDPMREALVYILSEHAALFGECGCGICTRVSEALRVADGKE